MAKTQFVDGSNLTATYVNTIYGSDASTGHNHQGLDQDGSAPKINLSNSVSGYLNLATNVTGTMDRYHLAAPATGTFTAQLYQLTGSTPKNYTIKYVVDSGITTIWWPQLVAHKHGELSGFYFVTLAQQTCQQSYGQDTAGRLIPIWLRVHISI